MRKVPKCAKFYTAAATAAAVHPSTTSWLTGGLGQQLTLLRSVSAPLLLYPHLITP
jgi:hypothetical protein